MVKGKTLEEVGEIRNKHIADELALPPVKIHCSVLAEDAIAAAIADIKAKRAAKDTSEAVAS
jgi:nitrogen fixation NifU-like protein